LGGRVMVLLWTAMVLFTDLLVFYWHSVTG
jgi:hypothetical protein